jgi:hypothetical protein
MEIRKYKNLHALNALHLQQFGLDRIENGGGPLQHLVVQASDGYPDHFRAEIRFINTQYIACASFFLFVTLRLASLPEFPLASRYPGYNIYCFEGDQFPHKPRVQYYIIAKDVEIVVQYAGENIAVVLGQSDRLEAGEEERQ